MENAVRIPIPIIGVNHQNGYCLHDFDHKNYKIHFDYFTILSNLDFRKASLYECLLREDGLRY